MNQLRFFCHFLLLPAVLAAGCGHMAGSRTEPEAVPVTAPAPSPSLAMDSDPRRSLRSLERRVKALEEHLTYCPKDVRQLLAEVRKTCSVAEQTCGGQPVGMAIMKSDSTEQLRLLSMMHKFEHQAFYLPSAPRPLLSEEKRLLRDVVSPTWLENGAAKTTFIVVSHPENKTQGAESRATDWSLQFAEEIASIVDELGAHTVGERGRAMAASSFKSSSVGTSQIASETDLAHQRRKRADQLVLDGRIMHWIYQFSDPQERLPADDAPRGKDRLTRSVWVYRVNC